jgi:hypothetical protein
LRGSGGCVLVSAMFKLVRVVELDDDEEEEEDEER